MGSYCYQGENNSTCAKQQLVGTNCTKDEQCENTLGCNNGMCTIYFSLADGTVVTNPNSNKWSVCSSGEVDEVTNRCRTRTNTVAADVPCDTDCSYTDKEANTTVVEPESCKCAMNASGNRYCILANGIFKSLIIF
jgi:hypothetical protein